MLTINFKKLHLSHTGARWRLDVYGESQQRSTLGAGTTKLALRGARGAGARPPPTQVPSRRAAVPVRRKMRSRALAPPTNYPRAVLPLITSLLQRRLLASAAASGRPKRKARMRPSWLGLGLGLGLGLRG